MRVGAHLDGDPWGSRVSQSCFSWDALRPVGGRMVDEVHDPVPHMVLCSPNLRFPIFGNPWDVDL